MKPKGFIIRFAFLIVAFSTSLYTIATDAASGKTNIVFIMADDLGFAQIGCYGSNYYKTPHIDKLAKEGLKFTNAYAESAV